MKINRKSWHYRFNDWASNGKDPPKSLCPYFWTTVIHLVVCIWAFLVIPATVVSLAIWAVGAVINDWLTSLIVTGIVVAAIGAIISGFAAFVYFIAMLADIFWWFRDRRPRKAYKQKDHWPTPKPRKEKAHRGPSLVWEYLKALKAKACPTIEYVGE